MKPILKFKTEKYRVCSLGNECSVPDLLGTRILQNNLEFHLEENDEIIEGYGTLTSSYREDFVLKFYLLKPIVFRPIQVRI